MSQGPYSGPPQPSGGSGMTVLIIVLVVFGVIGIVCVGICGLGFLGLRWGVENAPKLAEGIGDAVKAGFMQVQAGVAVQSNEKVREKLGEPITVDSQSADKTDLAAGTASFDFEVSGPKGKGKAHGEGRREGDQWKITQLQVQLSDGTTIDIDPGQALSNPLGPGGVSPVTPPITIEPESALETPF